MVPVLALAACGGGDEGAAVEGTFAAGLAPTGVWVVEAERGEPTGDDGFRLDDLTPGPVSLRLMDGDDTAAVLNLSGLAPGARLRLDGLRVDRESGMAFPREVRLDGGDMVTVNGLRMAPASRIPRAVDARGAVLAWSSDPGALLVRPDDAGLPDLRVVAGAATEWVGEDGGGADATLIEPGDSVRVEGRADDGYVLATRVTVPTRLAAPAAADDDDATVARSSDDDDDNGGSVVGRIPRGGSATAAPAHAAPRVRPSHRGRGRGHGKGRGKNKG